MRNHANTKFCAVILRQTRREASTRGLRIPHLTTYRFKIGLHDYFDVYADQPGSDTHRVSIIWQGRASCASDAKAQAIEAVYIKPHDERIEAEQQARENSAININSFSAWRAARQADTNGDHVDDLFDDLTPEHYIAEVANDLRLLADWQGRDYLDLLAAFFSQQQPRAPQS